MVVSAELHAQILRYYHVEKWRRGTIARQLGVHRDVVARVLAQAGLPAHGAAQRPTRIDPYLPFILKTLETFPTLTAARLYAMVYERGYRGGRDHFRHMIGRHRPRPKAEAYLRLGALPGEEAQTDWAHMGRLQIGRAQRPLMAFVMVLSYSRRIFLRFFLDARMDAFLTGHALAFEAFGSVPRVILYDNLKSAVLERQGDTIRFNPTLLAFAAHYRFDPRPVGIARGNEKGRVERAIRYIRDNFFAARPFTDIEDLNAQAMTWCEGPAADRPCPGEAMSVREAFALEAPRLAPLPDNPFPLSTPTAVSIGKTPYARFDKNDYSVPHTHVRRQLTLLADPKEVRILDGAALIARHPRSYDAGAQIEDPAHIQTLRVSQAPGGKRQRHQPPGPRRPRERRTPLARGPERPLPAKHCRRPQPPPPALRRSRTRSRHPGGSEARRARAPSQLRSPGHRKAARATQATASAPQQSAQTRARQGPAGPARTSCRLRQAQGANP